MPANFNRLSDTQIIEETSRVISSLLDNGPSNELTLSDSNLSYQLERTGTCDLIKSSGTSYKEKKCNSFPKPVAQRDKEIAKRRKKNKNKKSHRRK